MKNLRCLVLLLLLVVCWSSPAVAQSEADKATARALAIEAQQALKAEDYQAAADKFRRAESLYHAPTLLVGLGRAYVGLGKYVEAMESYNRVIREKIPDNASDAFINAVEDAKREVVGLDQKIAWVTIVVGGSSSAHPDGPSSPAVTLDGVEVSVASLGVKRAVNPGDHELIASADGFEQGSTSFSVVSGQAKDVTLDLVAAAATTGESPTVDEPVDTTDEGDSVMPVLGWTAIGIGGAGLALGAVMGGLAMAKHGDLSDACGDGGQCPADQQDSLDSYRTFGLVSTVGFIAGGVLAASGVVLLLAAPSDSAEAAGQVRLQVGLGHAHAAVRF